jgi:hypothetical protein
VTSHWLVDNAPLLLHHSCADRRWGGELSFKLTFVKDKDLCDDACSP